MPDEVLGLAPILSDAEKQAIVARVQFEAELRKTLGIGPGPKPPSSFLSSAVGLLLLGSLLSGVLVPLFQFTQKAFESRRASRFENQTFYLNKMRAAFDDLASINGPSGDLVEQFERIANVPRLDADTYARFGTEFVGAQKERVARNAKLLGYSLYMKRRRNFDAALRRYVTASANLARNMQTAVRQLYEIDTGRHGAGAEPARAQLIERCQGDIDESITMLNTIDDELSDLLKAEIGGLEDARSRFLF